MVNAKRKYKKKTPKQRLEKKLDRLWQSIVCPPDTPCELCGRLPACGHHIVLKSRCKALRWVIENGIPLCPHCHYLVHNVDPREYNARIDEKIGKERVEYLREHRQDEFKENKQNYNKTIKYLEGKV